MDKQKNTIGTALAESLQSLMERKLFEKITIKQICDETGVIRATFYNHFEDKYDCLRFIIYSDLSDSAAEHVRKGDLRTGIRIYLETIEKKRSFYRRAYTNVTGQNGFEEMLEENIELFVREYFDAHRKDGFLPEYNNELISAYYAAGIFCTVKMLIFEKNNIHTAENAMVMLRDMASHTFLDFSNPAEE